MTQITLTLDLTPKALEILKLLTTTSVTLTEKTDEPAPTYEQLSFDDIESGKDKNPAKKAAAKDKGPAVQKEAPAKTKEATPAITLTDVRTIALRLSKAGKQKLLKEIFAKYGAEKLSDIAAENYVDLMADLEAVNE